MVSVDTSAWARQGAEAAEFELIAGADGVYRLPTHAFAPLATFAYTWDRVPGICLHRGRADGLPPYGASEFRFYDASGDGTADALTLSGSAVTLGQRGGDYEDDCGSEPFPLKMSGKVVDQPIDLKLEGDAMHARLLIEGGFLSEGSATISWKIPAEPLDISGVTHGFFAPVVLEPGSTLDWRVAGVDLLGRPFRNGPIDFPVPVARVEPWLLVTDGGFESLASAHPMAALR